MAVYTKVFGICHGDAPHRDMELTQFAQVHHMAALQFVTDGVVEFRQHQPHVGGLGRAVGLYLLFNLIERYFAAFHGVCKILAIVLVASDLVSNQSEMYCHDIKKIKLIKMLCVCNPAAKVIHYFDICNSLSIFSPSFSPPGTLLSIPN
jgi:hypothetical protein